MSVRQRTRRACQPCRRRKRRCDGQQPCRACAEFDYDCIYADLVDRPSASQGVVAVTAEAPISQDATREHQDFAEQQVPTVGHGFDVERDEDKYYEPNKLRSYDANSAISFRRALSMTLNSGTTPRIHSFAYNFGIIPETFAQVPDTRLFDFVDLDLAEQLTRRYFDVVNPVFDVVDTGTHFQSLRALWDGMSSISPFETLAAFVILLGSFFTVPNQLPLHQELLQYAQDLLERSDIRNAPSLVHVEHLQAWILRTIYVRCTTRPNIAWLSSSMTLHIAESLGLHREHDTVSRLGIDEHRQSTYSVNTRRRLFWLAWMLNRMVSFEIGRSPTLINDINIGLPLDVPNGGCLKAIQTYLKLYPGGGHFLTTSIQECLDNIAPLSQSAEDLEQPLLALINADMALGLYREMHKLNIQSLEKSGQRFVRILKPAFAAAQTLLEDTQPWWFVVSVPFQSVCSALSIGKSTIIQLLPEAMRVLQATSQRFGTKMTNEADQTARNMRAALQAKNEDAAILNSVLASTALWASVEQGIPQDSVEPVLFWGNEF